MPSPLYCGGGAVGRGRETGRRWAAVDGHAAAQRDCVPPRPKHLQKAAEALEALLEHGHNAAVVRRADILPQEKRERESNSQDRRPAHAKCPAPLTPPSLGPHKKHVAAKGHRLDERGHNRLARHVVGNVAVALKAPGGRVHRQGVLKKSGGHKRGQRAQPNAPTAAGSTNTTVATAATVTLRAVAGTLASPPTCGSAAFRASSGPSPSSNRRA